jgi:hypothetical protein
MTLIYIGGGIMCVVLGWIIGEIIFDITWRAK